MVIKGATRGNGKQLANYLLSQKDNSTIHILNVNGKQDSDKSDLRYSLLEWSLMSELTKSDNGLYHAQLNPAYGFDKEMSPEDWNKAADILAKHIGYEGQRRAVVLHEKKDRIHAHLVFERYDHAKGTMKSVSWNYLAHDRARHEIEKELQHNKTPHRNANQKDIKTELSALWQQHHNGKDFVRAAQEKGYSITDGYTTSGGKKRPFGVVDKNGRAFDLARQIEHAKTKEIRIRLEEEKLPTERGAISAVRSRQSEINLNQVQETANDDKAKFKYTKEAKAQEQQETKTYQFKYQGEEQTKDKARQQQERVQQVDEMKESGQQATETKKEKLLRQFDEMMAMRDKSHEPTQDNTEPTEPNKNETKEEKSLRQFDEMMKRRDNSQDQDTGREVDDYDY